MNICIQLHLVGVLETRFTYLLTYSMVQNPSWEANWFGVSQEIPPPAFHGTRRFITALTRIRHLSLSWASPITRTILGEQYKSFSSSLCNLLHSPVTSSLVSPNILLNTMFSNTLSFLSSRNVNDQVSHPYKTLDKIIVLYILIFN